ncbi:MAG: hypothetical protein R3F42_00065 [Pseudomonadota bacterium]
MSNNVYQINTRQQVAPDTEIDERLLKTVVRFNTLLTGLVMGVLGAASLFFITLLSLRRGLPDPGHYLNLLGVFLPGYEVSPTGAWIGLLWGGVIGALCGAALYRIYARNLREHVRSFLAQENANESTQHLIVPIGGNALGLALGSVTAGSLILTTSWLVLRGTAEESIHARLLEHYLAGYSVSFTGSLIGAAQLFLVVYLLCQLWSGIYNSIIHIRHRRWRDER